MTTFPWLARRAVGWSVLTALLGGAVVVEGTHAVPDLTPQAAGLDEGPSDDELEAKRLAMLRRIEAKREAAQAVLMGRLTPAEAVERFRTFRAELRQRYLAAQGSSATTPFEEEGLCREVLTYARDILRDRPDGAEEALTRLEQELRAHSATQGLTPEVEKGGGR
jgi:hypothetical protein